MLASIRERLEDRLSLPAPTGVAALVAVLALSATGWQLLRWYDALSGEAPGDAHLPVIAPPAADPLPLILSANVFGAPTPAATVSQTESVAREATGFVLRAAFAGENGGGGAIIENSAGQADWYTVGQSVAPGLVLKEVHADHVMFDRGGIRERLQFERLSQTTVAQTGTATSATPQESVPDFSLQPGQPQPIPQDLPPEEKANLIRQRLEELRNRTRT